MQMLVPVQVALEPHEMLFETGDNSEGGIYVVVEGALGVFLAGSDSKTRHTNTLHPGESVGDLDVLDGEGCRAPICCTRRFCAFLSLAIRRTQSRKGCLPGTAHLTYENWCVGTRNGLSGPSRLLFLSIHYTYIVPNPQTRRAASHAWRWRRAHCWCRSLSTCS
jgi:CRP-like cAMP-binding protein